MDLGRNMLGRRHVQASVPHTLHEVQVEATFKDGTKLVTIHNPIASDDGDLELALYGTFFPIPDKSVFGELEKEDAIAPGICISLSGQTYVFCFKTLA